MIDRLSTGLITSWRQDSQPLSLDHFYETSHISQRYWPEAAYMAQQQVSAKKQQGIVLSLTA